MLLRAAYGPAQRALDHHQRPLAEKRSDTPDARAEARVWTVRCRTEQGYVRAAADLARSSPAEVCSAGDAGTALRLWRVFVTLYDSGDRLFSDVIAEFSALCAGWDRPEDRARR